MYSKIRTLNDDLSLAKSRIDLPRDAIIDEIYVKFDLTVANTSGSTWAGTVEKVLAAIEEIRVVSDGSNVHYAISARDAVLLNTYNCPDGFAPNLKGTVSIDNSESADLSYTIRLDEGDILAVSKDNLEMKVILNTAIDTGVTLTALVGEVSIVENVLTPEEMIANYGPNLEYAAEPKVYALSGPVSSSTDLQSALDLPTGSLHRAALLCFVAADGTLGSVDPTKIGLINTSPDRREVLHADWAILRAQNGATYDLGGAPPSGVARLDFARDVTTDGFGLRGWRFTKGDWQIAAKTANAATLRYICLEHVVNAGVFDKAERAVLELT